MGPKRNNNSMVSKQMYDELLEKVKALENRVGILEDKNAVLEKVTSKLEEEIDRLDQYGRRSNVILSNLELPAGKEDQTVVERTVKEIITNQLNLPEAADEIDKVHRVGKKKDHQGKKYQNVIIRFKSHRSRYSVYRNRKQLQNGVKMNPNLTKKRGDVLYKSSELVKDVAGIDFTFANIHGDLCVRLAAARNGDHVFTFHSIEELRKILEESDIVLPGDEGEEEE